MLVPFRKIPLPIWILVFNGTKRNERKFHSQYDAISYFVSVILQTQNFLGTWICSFNFIHMTNLFWFMKTDGCHAKYGSMTLLGSGKGKKNKAPGFRDLNWLFPWLIVICLLISLELIVIHWLYCGCPSKSKRHLCSFTYMAKTFYLNVNQAQGATGHHHQRKLITSIPPQYWSELLSCFILHVHIMYKYLLKF